MTRRLRRPSILLAIGLSLALRAAPGRADDAPEAAFNQWRSAFDAADKRVGDHGSLREALDQAGKNQSRMRELARGCQARLGDLEAAAFQEKFWRGEWERAQREVKRKSEAKDRRYDELMAELGTWTRAQNKILDDRNAAYTKRLASYKVEHDRLDQWFNNDNAWKARVNAQFASAETIPKDPQNYPSYLAAWNAANEENKRLNDSINRYNEAIKPANRENALLKAEVVAIDNAYGTLKNQWNERMEKIRRFAAEEGKQVLAAQQVASQKEREYRERSEKHAKLRQTQQTESAELAGLLANANATLQVVTEALDAPPPAAANPSAPAPAYIPRTSDAAARATVLPPSSTPAGPPPPPMRAHILVLGETTGDAAGQWRHRLQTEAAADALATQYAAVATVEAKPVVAATTGQPDAGAPAAALAVSLEAAPVGAADGPGDGAVRLSEDALTRAFDPRVFISDGQYRAAQAALARYGPLSRKLRAQLDKMFRERGKLAGYNAEFAALRHEIQLNAIGDLLGTYAAALKLKEAADLEKIAMEGNAARKALLETRLEHLKRVRQAVETAKLDASRREADRTPDGKEQAKKRMETVEDGLTALTEVIMDQSGNPEAQFTMEQLGNMMKGYAQIRRQDMAPEKKPGERLRDDARFTVKLASIACVPVALGVGLEGLGERGMEWAITQDAVDSLNAATRSQDDALIYLGNRLMRAELIARDAQKTVADYEAVPEAARRGFQLGR